MSGSTGTPSLTTTVEGLARSVRPWQWYKQGVMLLGILFSRNMFDISAWADLLVGILAFTAAASAAYVFNDIGDIEQDRNHPEKRHRPIASGQVSVLSASLFAVVLVIVSAVAAVSLGWLFAGILAVYFTQNALYSVYLKQLVHIDVIVVAIGFVLRAAAGVVAIDVFLSPWLIVSTFLLALVLALGKRRHELTRGHEGETRRVLDKYSESDVDQLLVITMATLLMAYSLYTFSRSDPAMMVTLPFAFYGVFRYHHLVHTTNVAGQPEYLLTDTPSVANLLLWGCTTIAILYGVPAVLRGVL